MDYARDKTRYILFQNSRESSYERNIFNLVSKPILATSKFQDDFDPKENLLCRRQGQNDLAHKVPFTISHFCWGTKNANIWGYVSFLGAKFFSPPDVQETFPSFE